MISVAEQHVLDRFFRTWLSLNVLPAYREVPYKPHGAGPAPKTIVEAISEHLTLDRESHCWEWTESCPDGVPQVTVRVPAYSLARRTVPVSVLMWEMWLGQLPKGAQVYSLCDNARCVSPHHLAANLPTGATLAGLLPCQPDWGALVEEACRVHGIPMAKDHAARYGCCASHAALGRAPV